MIQTNLIPIFYYPLKVVFVDDNYGLLSLFQRSFAEKFIIETFLAPFDALKYLKNNYVKMYDPLVGITNFIENDDATHVGVNIKNIIKIANASERFNAVGILVTDHDMPGMNGLELCQILTANPMKKILLTGQSLEKSAIESLNNNIINCYIEKSSLNVIDDIERYIRTFMFRYFLDLTQSILGSATQNQLAILKDLSFVRIFKEILSKYQISEYYLLDARGSFLLIDVNNERYVLNVHNNDSLNEFCNFFVGEKDIADLINSLKNQEKIPFFGLGIDPINVALGDWDKYFYPANEEENFIWNFIKI